MYLNLDLYIKINFKQNQLLDYDYASQSNHIRLLGKSIYGFKLWIRSREAFAILQL